MKKISRGIAASDHCGPSTLDRGLRPARDMFAERRARLCPATSSDERHQVRLGKNAALLVAPADAGHVIENGLQNCARAIVVA